MNQIKTMGKMSPTSLKVTLKQLELGQSLTLQECLQMEFRLAGNHVIKSDFKEGVRSLLIDRDQNPKWQPAKLEDVSDELVNNFFKPLPNNDELTFPDLQAKL